MTHAADWNEDETINEAIDRAERRGFNKGWDACKEALEKQREEETD